MLKGDVAALSIAVVFFLLAASHYGHAIALRQKHRLIAWITHRVAELERRQYGIAMPPSCPEEERHR